MAASSAVDSRAYAFVYPIRGAHDIPADFCLQTGLGELCSGVFLPQDQAGWFSKPRYPACVLLLVSADLVIATHPSSREREIRIPLQEVLAIESSKMLLDGRIIFHTVHCHYTYRYNTRDARHVDDFLFHVRQALMKAPPIPRAGSWCFGGSLDLKFATAESRELDGREQLLLRFFSPPKHSLGKHWVFRREHWRPGQYVGLTTRRLLWISDGYDGGRDLYGTVSRYAPLSRVTGVSLTFGEAGSEFRVSLEGELQWAIPVPADLHSEAESFTREMRQLRLNVD